jgi:hypothetical protein
MPIGSQPELAAPEARSATLRLGSACHHAMAPSQQHQKRAQPCRGVGRTPGGSSRKSYYCREVVASLGCSVLWSVQLKKLRIVTIGFGTGRQRTVLERWTNPKLSRRTCTCEYGLPSCPGKAAGVAKRPRERPPRNPHRHDSPPFASIAVSRGARTTQHPYAGPPQPISSCTSTVLKYLPGLGLGLGAPRSTRTRARRSPSPRARPRC